jgi:hypothetical protein
VADIDDETSSSSPSSAWSSVSDDEDVEMNAGVVVAGAVVSLDQSMAGGIEDQVHELSENPMEMAANQACPVCSREFRRVLTHI